VISAEIIFSSSDEFTIPGAYLVAVFSFKIDLILTDMKLS
jgi:hypothetical protein